MALYMWTWWQVQRRRIRDIITDEGGAVGMEYAVVAAVVIVAVAAALTAAEPSIEGIVSAALTQIEGALD